MYVDSSEIAGWKQAGGLVKVTWDGKAGFRAAAGLLRPMGIPVCGKRMDVGGVMTR